MERYTAVFVGTRSHLDTPPRKNSVLYGYLLNSLILHNILQASIISCLYITTHRTTATILGLPHLCQYSHDSRSVLDISLYVSSAMSLQVSTRHKSAR
ncbi:hypothetical protein J6590_018975 [Homalodisca vitripennis]|nr:hypothetical protein J6590_018975 [Homalodisca vitripennis]